MFNENDRRPIKSRNTFLAKKLAQALKKLGVRPNHISILSILFAVLSAFCLIISIDNENTTRSILLIAAAGFILLRLLCNLFDGMLAIEGGFASKSGEIYNDLPDRPSDIVILIAAGIVASNLTGGEQLGWLAALLAVMTAYVRVLGKSAGTQQFFMGPMAKQHRMFVMIVACLVSAFSSLYVSSWIFTVALLIIIFGSFITIYRRLKVIVSTLENSS